MGPEAAPQPVTWSVALGGVLTTGVAMIAIFVPGLDALAQAAIIAFGNAVLLAASVLWAIRRVTPIERPSLEKGTVVNVTTPAGEVDYKATV